MKGLVLKDFLLVRKYAMLLLVYYLITGLLCTMPFMTEEGNPLYDAAISGATMYLTAAIGSVFVMTTFAHDEISGWMRQACTILSRRKYLAAKYLFHLLIGIIGIAINTAILLVLAVQYEVTATSGVILLSGLAGVEILVYMVGVLVPLLVRFGVEKGRMLWFLAFLPIAGILFFCETVSFHGIVTIILPRLVPLLLVPIAVVFGVMLALGMRWMRKKEL